MRARSEFPSCRLSICLLSNRTSTDQRALPAGIGVLKPQKDFRLNWIDAAPGLEGDSSTSGVMQRSGTGRFLVSVMALAGPVQNFVTEYSSYDYGVSPDSWLAVHIRPKLSRGYAGVSVRLRF
ncbi:MAG TPA: hypothetical protein VGL38_07955 [bacterium]